MKHEVCPLSRCRHDGISLEMTLPRVQPIAPTWRKQPFDDPHWLFDCKYDGFRALCYIERGRSRLISRNGNLMTRFDALGGALAAWLDVEDAIIDGEVIVADVTGRPQFYDLLRGTQAPAYVAFDIVWLNGADLRSLPLHERRRVLRGILSFSWLPGERRWSPNRHSGDLRRNLGLNRTKVFWLEFLSACPQVISRQCIRDPKV